MALVNPLCSCCHHDWRTFSVLQGCFCALPVGTASSGCQTIRYLMSRLSGSSLIQCQGPLFFFQTIYYLMSQLSGKPSYSMSSPTFFSDRPLFPAALLWGVEFWVHKEPASSAAQLYHIWWGHMHQLWLLGHASLPEEVSVVWLEFTRLHWLSKQVEREMVCLSGYDAWLRIQTL